MSKWPGQDVDIEAIRLRKNLWLLAGLVPSLPQCFDDIQGLLAVSISMMRTLLSYGDPLGGTLPRRTNAILAC